MVVVEMSSRKSSRQRQVIKKILHKDGTSPGVTGDQSSDDVVEVVDNDRNKIEQCIEIKTSKLKQSKNKLYSLMASRMDEDDPSEYCCRLRQVDAEQVLIKGKIVELKGELRALGIYCHLEKDESSTDVHNHKYNLPLAVEVTMVLEELILTDNFKTVASNHIQVINSEKRIFATLFLK